MLRILKSIIMIAVVSAVAVGATGAYFTDKETVPSSLASGKLDVELRGANASGIVIPMDTTQYFMGGMVPGVEMGPYEVQIYNKGWGQSTMPVKYAWSSKYTGDSGKLYNNINVKVREGNCDWLNAPWFAGQGYIYDGKLKDMPAHLQTQMGDLNPNITRCTWFYFTLDASANNSYQGLNTLFDLVLDATQTNNPGW